MKDKYDRADAKKLLRAFGNIKEEHIAKYTDAKPTGNVFFKNGLSIAAACLVLIAGVITLAISATLISVYIENRRGHIRDETFSASQTFDGFTVSIADVFGNENTTYFMVYIEGPIDPSEYFMSDFIVKGNLKSDSSYIPFKIGTQGNKLVYILRIRNNNNGRKVEINISGINSTKDPMCWISTETFKFSDTIKYDLSECRQFSYVDKNVSTISIYDKVIIIHPTDRDENSEQKEITFIDKNGNTVTPEINSLLEKSCHSLDIYCVFESTSDIKTIIAGDTEYNIE